MTSCMADASVQTEPLLGQDDDAGDGDDSREVVGSSRCAAAGVPILIMNEDAHVMRYI